MLRDKASHTLHCAALEKDTTGEVSKEYGINRDSALNELSYFHVCDGSLLPDVMHDVLEGMSPRTMASTVTQLSINSPFMCVMAPLYLMSCMMFFYACRCAPVRGEATVAGHGVHRDVFHP